MKAAKLRLLLTMALETKRKDLKKLFTIEDIQVVEQAIKYAKAAERRVDI